MEIKTKIRWPQKGDNPFLIKSTDPNSPTWCSLKWLSSWEIDDSLYAAGFKEAADKIILELSRGKDTKHPDFLFLPIAYLYRHSIELKMKQIIKLALRIRLLEINDELNNVLNSHNLHKLWIYSKTAVHKYWPNGQKEEINAAEKIIQEFHKIDKTGQNLRYSKSITGQPTINSLPESVQLADLKDVADAIYNFLDGCEMGFDHALEIYQEMMRDCQ